jgi:hypothetical protein
MKYMLLIYSAESCWTDEDRKACMIESMGICDQLAAQGKFVTSAPLRYVPTATRVRVRNGQAQTTTGPFAETTEQLGGYYILHLNDLDEAIAIASRLPPVTKGTVEIRPLFQLDGLPAEKLSLVHEHDGSWTAYMLLCYDDEEAWRAAGADAHRAAMMEAAALTHDLDARGQYISASPLHPVATATYVRVRNGQRMITDGPFAETREVLGGYYLILAKDQREAETIAARHSGARVGAVEVRPLFDLAALRGT